MDLHTAVAISMLPGWKSRTAARFKEIRGSSAGSSLEAVIDALAFPESERVRIGDAARTAADRALAAAVNGIEPVAWFDPRYPPLLTVIGDPPPVLWTWGDCGVLTRPAVAIVGSRAATPYAIQVSASLARDLARRGLVVTSGLARGVDSSAHRGCLEAGGATTGVLGSGVDRIYPAEHAPLAARVAAQGLIVSELAPGAAPLPEHFPLRNRIISGLSLAVVVVEASEKSGSLITARFALEQGRDVLAVPGSVLTGRNRGSHALIKDGAKVVETADDILEELGWPAAPSADTHGRNRLISDPLLRQMQAGETYGLETLVAGTGLPASRLLTRLTELELLGKVAPAGGGRWILVT